MNALTICQWLQPLFYFPIILGPGCHQLRQGNLCDSLRERSCTVRLNGMVAMEASIRYLHQGNSDLIILELCAEYQTSGVGAGAKSRDCRFC